MTQVDNFNKVFKFDNLHPLNRPALYFDQQVVKLIFNFAKVERKDFLTADFAISEFDLILHQIHNNSLDNCIFFQLTAPFFYFFLANEKLVNCFVFFAVFFDFEAKSIIREIDYSGTFFEGDNFGFQDQSFLKKDGLFGIVLLGC